MPILLRRLALVLVPAALLLGCGADPAPPPNLLILAVDTLRADALERVATPNLDRLIEHGTSFSQAITPVPRTTPAVASLLTGLEPHHHGSREVGDPIDDGATTLPEILAANGYRTLGVTTNPAAGPRQKLQRGFEHYRSDEDIAAAVPGLYRDFSGAPPSGPGWAQATTQQALRLVAESGLADPGDGEASDPFFLFLFYFDPHFLYLPPSPWQDDVDGAACRALYDALGSGKLRAGAMFADLDGVASRAAEDCRALYDAEVAYLDHQIGVLLAALRMMGLLDNTVVVFTADHGENFGEGGLYFEHGDNVHDAGLRIPLVFSGPGIAHGRTDPGAVSLVDVAPTALSLLDIPGGEGRHLDGVDLSPRLDPAARPSAERHARRVVFAESASSMWNESSEHLTTGRRWARACLNGARFTLCSRPTERPDVFELYDHEADPHLRRDLAAERPEVVARLRTAWERWPPESARERVARTARFKLVERPRFDGGYDAALYDLAGEAGESRDVAAEHPDILAHLRAALEAWTASRQAPTERAYDPAIEESLRALGYLP